jgi:hypothetical protein
MVVSNPDDVLQHVFESLADCLTPEVAQRILEIRVDPRIQPRVDILADKANEGLLTSDERAEYEAYIEACDLLAILKAYARSVLSR